MNAFKSSKSAWTMAKLGHQPEGRGKLHWQFRSEHHEGSVARGNIEFVVSLVS